MMIKKKKFFVFWSALLIFLLAFNLTFAREFEVEWPEIPGTDFVKGNKCPTTGCPPDNFSDFIVYFFNLSLVIAGFITFVMIVVAGVQYLILAIESPATAQSALSRIKNALLALVLLFGVFLILNAINPELLVPGLKGTHITGTPLQKITSVDFQINDGIKICSDDRCENCIQVVNSEEDLSSAFIDYDPQTFNYFKILDPGLQVEFYAQPKFKGEMTFAEGTTVCTHFSSLPYPDLSGKVHSVKLVEDSEEVFYSLVCKVEKPAGKDKCIPFPLDTGEGPRKLKIKYGVSNNHIIKLTSKAIYDLASASYDPITNDNAKWMSIPGGSIAILCHGASSGNEWVEGDHCFFISETTPLKYYGDVSSLSSEKLDEGTSLIAFKGVDELDVFASKNNKTPCKGAIFYIGPSYNRIFRSPPGLNWVPEAAAFPLGMGNLDNPGVVDGINSSLKYYTRIDDIDGHLEIIAGDSLAPKYQISAIKLIGNCKLKICDDTNLGGNCDVLTGNFYPDLSALCRPLSCYDSCTASGSPGATVNCTSSCATVPPACGSGSCSCQCTIPPGETSCSCGCCCGSGNDWDNAIKSFILCNKENNNGYCNF